VTIASPMVNPTPAGSMLTSLTDPLSGQQASVQQFHNADNQAPGATAYGLLTGGVAQLLNAGGNIDRQRETGVDGIPSQGIVTGAAQFAQAFATTDNTDNFAASLVKTITGATNAAPVVITSAAHGLTTGNQVVVAGVLGNQGANGTWVITVIDANTFSLNGSTGTGAYTSGGTATVARTFTPVAMTVTVNGVAWAIQTGSVLTIDSGANQEIIVVLSTTSTTFNAITAKAHNGTGTAFAISGFVYNQERDAAGELDGANGRGTAVAAEYEYNGGALLSTASYDRNRNMMGKAVASGSIANNPLAAGSTTLTLNAAPTRLTPGQWIFILDGANSEWVLVGASYVLGSTSVPISGEGTGGGTKNSHNQNVVVKWSQWGAQGPLGSKILPDGEGIEGIMLFDPTTAANDAQAYILAQGAAGALNVSPGGNFTASVPTGAGNTVVKNSQTRLCKVLVTTAGAGAGSVLIYDNATTNSGTVVGVIPATIAIGAYYTFDLPCANGITVTNVASGPVLTVSYL